MTLSVYAAAVAITIVLSACMTGALLGVVYAIGRRLERRKAERFRLIVREVVVTREDLPRWTSVAGLPAAFSVALIGTGAVPMGRCVGSGAVSAPAMLDRGNAPSVIFARVA